MLLFCVLHCAVLLQLVLTVTFILFCLALILLICQLTVW